MSWASRRRTMYLGGVILFFALVVGVPLTRWWLSSVPPSCPPGMLRPAGQSSGPCSVLDSSTLQPLYTLWARSFQVRPGSYTAVAYLENPNEGAGVRAAHYHFGLYDSQNVLVAEYSGTTFVMPSGITPVLATDINTGNRTVTHTYFTLTDPSLVWEPMQDAASSVNISNPAVSNAATLPRLDAQATNSSFNDIQNLSFVAVIFDPYGNALAASGTEVPLLRAGAKTPIAFTWPQPFPSQTGRVDVIPLLPPTPASK